MLHNDKTADWNIISSRLQAATVCFAGGALKMTDMKMKDKFRQIGKT